MITLRKPPTLQPAIPQCGRLSNRILSCSPLLSSRTPSLALSDAFFLCLFVYFFFGFSAIIIISFYFNFSIIIIISSFFCFAPRATTQNSILFLPPPLDTTLWMTGFAHRTAAYFSDLVFIVFLALHIQLAISYSSTETKLQEKPSEEIGTLYFSTLGAA